MKFFGDKSQLRIFQKIKRFLQNLIFVNKWRNI